MVGVRGCGDERAICSSMWIWASIYNIYMWVSFILCLCWQDGEARGRGGRW